MRRMPFKHTSRKSVGVRRTALRPKLDVEMSMPAWVTSPTFASTVSPGRMRRRLGERVSSVDAQNTSDFGDVPTALRTIVARLDDSLQIRVSKPVIVNPVLASEFMSDLWTDEQYANFRNKVHQYREWIDDAYTEKDWDESIGKWRRVFGDDFAEGVTVAKATSVTEAARTFVMGAMQDTLAASQDLVTLFGRFGTRALPPGFDSLPHKQRPPWRPANGTNVPVQVVASLHREKGEAKERDITSGAGPLPKKQWLRFEAKPSPVFQLGAAHDVRWRVTNTDREAMAANCLRGGFEDSVENGATRSRLAIEVCILSRPSSCGVRTASCSARVLRSTSSLARGRRVEATSRCRTNAREVQERSKQ